MLVIQADYDEYLKLYRQLDGVATQFKRLKFELERNPLDDGVVQRIRALYEKYEGDEEFFHARQRHAEL